MVRCYRLSLFAKMVQNMLNSFMVFTLVNVGLGDIGYVYTDENDTLLSGQPELPYLSAIIIRKLVVSRLASTAYRLSHQPSH